MGEKTTLTRHRQTMAVGELPNQLGAISAETNPGVRSKAISTVAKDVLRGGQEALDGLIAQLGNPQSEITIPAIAVLSHPEVFKMYSGSVEALGIIITELSALFVSDDIELALTAAAMVQFIIRGVKLEKTDLDILEEDIVAGRERLSMAIALSCVEDES